MLYHLFVISDDLLTVNRTKYRSFTDAFQICCALYNHLSDFYIDLPQEGSNKIKAISKDKGKERQETEGIEQPLVDFEAFACC